MISAELQLHLYIIKGMNTFMPPSSLALEIKTSSASFAQHVYHVSNSN